MAFKRNSKGRADNVKIAHERALDAARGCDRFTTAVLVRAMSYEVSSNLLDMMKGLNSYYKSASADRVQEVKKKSDQMEEIMTTFQESMKVMTDKMKALQLRREKFARYKNGCAIPACMTFLCCAGQTSLAGILSFCSPDKIATLPVIGSYLTTHTTVAGATSGFFFGPPPTGSVAGIVPGSITAFGYGAAGCFVCSGLTCWEAKRYSKKCAELRKRIQNQEKKLGPCDASRSSDDVWPKIEDMCNSTKNLLQTLSKMSKMDEDMTTMWNPVKKLTTDALYLGEEINDFIKKNGDRATQDHLDNKGHDDLKAKLKEVEDSVRHLKVDTQAPNKHTKGFFSCTG